MSVADFIRKKLALLDRVLTERRSNYADPRINFRRIAAYWTVDFEDILKPGAVVSMLHVNQAMISLKKARILAGYQPDHALDGAGYFMTMAVCEELDALEKGEPVSGEDSIVGLEFLAEHPDTPVGDNPNSTIFPGQTEWSRDNLGPINPVTGRRDD